MGRFKDTVWCDGCGLEILWIPLQAGSTTYCCVDCQEGARCECRDLNADSRDSSRAAPAEHPRYTGR